MPLFSFEGLKPNVHPDAFVAPTATLVGDVVVEAGASIWYNTVIRADFGRVTVRTGANVQDGSVVHGPADLVTEIGAGATVAHLCVVHGAVLGEGCIVSNGATVLDAARVGAGALVAAHSLVPSGMEVPDGFLVSGVPAQIKRPVAGSGGENWVKRNASNYAALAQRHQVGVRLVES